MVDAARRLEAAGADLLLICTNTMHRMAHDVQSAVRIPLIHIADPTAERIVAVGLRKVGLLGRAFTMEQDFYKGRLSERFGLEVIVPDEKDRATVRCAPDHADPDRSHGVLRRGFARQPV
jgi:aspartate racemase